MVWRGRISQLKSLTRLGNREYADVAQLVAHNLAKVGVASSSLVIRSSAGIATRDARKGSPKDDHDTWVEPHAVAWPSG